MIFPLRHLRHWPALLATAALSLAAISTDAGAQVQTARLVKDANTSPYSFGQGIGWVAPLGKSAVFTRGFVKGGPELWISNGVPGGTRAIRETPFGADDLFLSTPLSFGQGAGARVAFHRTNPNGGQNQELWITDGTDAGTLRLFQTSPLESIQALNATTGGLFFQRGEWAGATTQLIFSDGTPAGTRSLNPPAEGSPPRFTHPSIHFATGPWCYFSANGNEMWRSDGTDAGTTKLATFPVLKDTHIWAWHGGSRVYVSATNWQDDIQELWACPLEGGEVTRLYPAPGASWWQMSEVTTFGDRLFFMARDDDSNGRLMVSDGTAATTREIPIPLNDGESAYDAYFRRWHGAFYALIRLWNEETDAQRQVLYRLDGTSDALTTVAEFKNTAYLFDESAWREQEEFLYLNVLNGAKNRSELWQTKGTPGSTRIVKNLPATHYLRAEYDSQVAATEAGVYFGAIGGPRTSGMSLWKKPRGKSGRAVRLTRPEKWTASGIPTFTWFNQDAKALTYEMTGGNLLSFVATGDEFELWRMGPDGKRTKAIWKPPVPMTEGGYRTFGFWGTTPRGAVFYFYDGDKTMHLYLTDGTARGTRLISDHSVGMDRGYPYDFKQVGDLIYYSTYDQDLSMSRLWRTDGTAEGTTMIVDTSGDAPVPLYYEKMVGFQGSLYFLASTGGKTALWRSDGTAAGTVMLQDTWAGGTPTNLAVAGGKLLFPVTFTHSSQLWQSDGTPAGTIAVANAPVFARDGIGGFTDLGNGTALFQGTTGLSTPRRWWRHDSTGTSEVPLSVTGTHFVNSTGEFQAVLGNKVIYTAGDGYHLWVSDGTTAGTRQISTDSVPIFNRNMLTVGDHVYFSAYSPEHSIELWRSDGTEAGTVLVADVEPGSLGSEPQGLKVMGGKLYFAANRRDVGQELFVIDLPAGN